MEQIVNLHVEKLPEGVYPATSDEIPGLVAQGCTVTETLEIARDVAKRLLEAQSERQARPALKETGVPSTTRWLSAATEWDDSRAIPTGALPDV